MVFIGFAVFGALIFLMEDSVRYRKEKEAEEKWKGSMKYAFNGRVGILPLRVRYQKYLNIDTITAESIEQGYWSYMDSRKEDLRACVKPAIRLVDVEAAKGYLMDYYQYMQLN